MTRMSLYGYISFAGVIIFTVLMLALHSMQPEISILYDAMSYYVYGQQGWMLPASLIGLGAGSLALAIGMWHTLRGGFAKAGGLFVAIWGLSLIVAAIYPTDPPGSWNQPPSTSGMIHFTAANLSFISLMLASVFLAPVLAKDSRWSPVKKWIIPITSLTVISLILIMISISSIFLSDGAPLYFGLTERLYILSCLCWIIMSSIGLRQTGR
ncbi:DUF998 domain-containing protein [Paenibacillus nasutitermitis]|uniref:DUF998 domain-containing protein n=1 Tax=Paenibacillus nasutitermitis TaxID=1652958 RepID=A0A917DZ06_9BACL|nr:DUF998 domain-containing protein [Paenibacillus nasutitermitis]GGD85900.1 hypothetical protein GCM10010911_50420 [Paenibacillus nasutitermitis]